MINNKEINKLKINKTTSFMDAVIKHTEGLNICYETLSIAVGNCDTYPNDEKNSEQVYKIEFSYEYGDDNDYSDDSFRDCLIRNHDEEEIGDIIIKNPLTDIMIEFLMMNDEELKKHINIFKISPNSYRQTIVDMICVLLISYKNPYFTSTNTKMITETSTELKKKIEISQEDIVCTVYTTISESLSGKQFTEISYTYSYNNDEAIVLKPFDITEDDSGEIVYNNAMVEKMIEFLMSSESNIKEYVGKETNYKVQIMIMLMKLWD